MSRLAKIAQTHILTQQPPQPSDSDSLFGAEITSERNIRKQKSRETAATEDEFEVFERSSIQNGAALKISKLFRALRSQDSQVSAKSSQIRSSLVRAKGLDDSHHDVITSKNPDAIELGAYLDRFFEFGSISDEVVTVAYVYLRRAVAMHSSIRAKHVHKLLAGCLLLAHKFLIETSYWSMDDFGCLSGVSGAQLKKIEAYVADQVLEYSL